MLSPDEVRGAGIIQARSPGVHLARRPTARSGRRREGEHRMTDNEMRLKREEFLRGAAGVIAVGSGLGLLAPRSALGALDAKKGGILQFVYSDTSAAETTDPTTQTGIAVSETSLNNVYDRLTYIHTGTWATTPRLAESWHASPDAKEWTFKLRRGVKFHNGKTLDSKDVAYSYGRILDKATGSSAYERLSSVLDPSGMKTPRTDTIVFKLKKPDAQFPVFAGLFQPGIVPAGVDPKKEAIGTGPFMLKSYDPTVGFELVRNPHYWKKGLPYLDGVRGVFIADGNTKTQAVTAGNADISDRIPFTLVNSIKKNPKLKLFMLPGAVFMDYSFDLTQDPFTDHRVAQAVKMAVDRKVLLQAALQGQGTTTGDVPELPSDPFYPPKRGVPGPDIAGAKKLLAAAGHKDGLQFTLTAGDLIGGELDMVTALKQVVAPAGIDIVINVVPNATFWSDDWLKKPAFNSYWNHRHPHEMLALLYRTGAVWNESKFSDPEVDRLTDAGAATLDPKKQRAIFQKALDLVATKSGTGTPFFATGIHVAKKRVNGIIVDPQQMFVLEGAWLS
jgi:peptide/nickel transport system substrate-binding protein